MTRPMPRFEPRTIDYQCKRCLLVLPSKPLPRPGALGPRGLPLLRLYGLPDGWELVLAPLGQDDHLHCAQCVADIANGSPVEL